VVVDHPRSAVFERVRVKVARAAVLVVAVLELEENA